MMAIAIRTDPTKNDAGNTQRDSMMRPAVCEPCAHIRKETFGTDVSIEPISGGILAGRG
jgi:hypothetical protein